MGPGALLASSGSGQASSSAGPATSGVDGDRVSTRGDFNVKTGGAVAPKWMWPAVAVAVAVVAAFLLLRKKG